MRLFLQALIGLGFLALLGCQNSVNSNSNFFLPAPQTTDNALAVAVGDALQHDKHLASLPIQAQVTEGVVTLNGYVKTIRQSDTAADVVSKVNGVRTVQNNLIVRK